MLNVPQRPASQPGFQPGGQAVAPPTHSAPAAPQQGQPQQPAQQQDQGGENPDALKAYVEQRMSQAKPEEQQFIIQALTGFKQLPQVMAIAIHPAIGEYFQELQQKIAASQQNSQGGVPQQGAPQPENPAQGGQPPQAGSTATATQASPLGM